MPWEPLPTGDGPREPAPVTAGLDRLVKGLGGPSADTVRGVFGRWADIVGEQIAAHTRPLSMRDGALQVAVDDPAWAPQLRFLEADIVRRVGEVLGSAEVVRIEVRVRPSKPPAKRDPEG
jgi:predicted nucleic acid-binding Zn ribbon protein